MGGRNQTISNKKKCKKSKFLSKEVFQKAEERQRIEGKKDSADFSVPENNKEI